MRINRIVYFFIVVVAAVGISYTKPKDRRYELLSELDDEFTYCLDLNGIDYFYNNPFIAIDIQYVECDNGVLSPHVMRMFDHWLLEEYNGRKQITASKGEVHCYSQMLSIMDSVSEDENGKYTRLRFLIPEDLEYLLIKYRLRYPGKQYTSIVYRIILKDDYYSRLVSENRLDKELDLLEKKLDRASPFEK